MPNDHAPGLLAVISGPSGVGKTTIVHAVRERLGALFSVSATTRPKSAQERDGVDYLFLDEPRFKRMIEDDEFLEHAHVFGRHWYGTPRGPVDEALAEGKLVLLDIDVQGALQVRERAPDAFLAFVLPPDEDTLPDRFLDEPLPDDPAARLDATQFAAAIRAYNKYRGWSSEGWIDRKQLERFGLENFQRPVIDE